MTKSRLFATRTSAAVCAVIVTLAAASAADAAVTCRARLSGEGTGTGLFGQSTVVARQNAVTDWTNRAGARHGRRFANLSLGRGATYDCRQGAIFQSKCVVTAMPCAQVPPKRKKRRPRR